jgi:hypothetical protein
MIKFFSNFSKFVPRATSYLLLILIALIPFSIRHVFDTPWNFHTGAYSDFTSVSLYMSDLILIGLIASVLVFHMKHRLPKYWLYAAYALGGWLILELLLQNSDLLPLQFYFTIRLAALVGFAAIVSQIDVSREKISWLFTGLGVIQTLIGLFQFLFQKSLGLYILGESHLSPDTLGVAKIVAHGTKMIRAYGTFPHPNLLAAFLVVSLAFNLYLLTKKYQFPRGILVYLALFINIFGLFLTFSRGGILAFGMVMALFTLILLINRQFSTTWRIALPVIAGILLSLAILYPFLTTRATITDNATKERLFYNKIGQSIINDHKVRGVGLGLSVLHMKQYSGEPLETWEIQPIHNYYLIAVAELGLGVIFLLILLIFPIYRLYKQKDDAWSAMIMSIIIGFLALFLFDHYFYTIWPTQLLLWVIVGLSVQSISRETMIK